jgi:hypothetical protein
MLTAGQKRRGLGRQGELLGVRQRVHPAVDREQPSSPHPTLDRALTHPGGEQLLAREPRPLMRGDRLYSCINGVVGSDPYPARSEQTDRPCR